MPQTMSGPARTRAQASDVKASGAALVRHNARVPLCYKPLRRRGRHPGNPRHPGNLAATKFSNH